MKKQIEIIVPCYNEEECITVFYEKIVDTFQALISEYEPAILFIDDGSRDNTLKEIKKVVKNKEGIRVRYLSFSRNFGKEAAIYVGFTKSTGDYVVLMDADLQHPPNLLKKMVEALEEGYDCATARRVSRKGEPIIRSMFSKTFYHILNRVSAINLVPGSTDFRMMKRPVAEAIISLSERERFTKGIYSWVGFQNKWIEYHNVERVAGKTKWSFRGLVRYASSGFVAFATTPLRGVIYLGMVIVLLAIVVAIYICIDAINHPGNRTGYASIMLLILFLGGVIITILGMIGEYMARIYMEVKRRPIYITRETNISEETKNTCLSAEAAECDK